MDVDVTLRPRRRAIYIDCFHTLHEEAFPPPFHLHSSPFTPHTDHRDSQLATSYLRKRCITVTKTLHTPFSIPTLYFTTNPPNPQPSTLWWAPHHNQTKPQSQRPYIQEPFQASLNEAYDILDVCDILDGSLAAHPCINTAVFIQHLCIKTAAFLLRQ